MKPKLLLGAQWLPNHVFATGVSRGGHMAFRLALEAPARFRAVAAVAANVPTPENFKCRRAGPGTSSVMIMNGTMDPVLFAGAMFSGLQKLERTDPQGS